MILKDTDHTDQHRPTQTNTNHTKTHRPKILHYTDHTKTHRPKIIYNTDHTKTHRPSQTWFLVPLESFDETQTNTDLVFGAPKVF